MKTLIIYASIEGQTRKIAEAIAARIEKTGGQAAVMNIGLGTEYGLERPDGVILCAPVHAGRYPTPFIDFTHREKNWLNTLPSALVSVSLAIRSDIESEREEAKHYSDALLAETGWKPLDIHHAAGALRYTEYDFFKRWIMKRIAKKEGGPVDASRDHEFTDWAKLDAFTDEFTKHMKVKG